MADFSTLISRIKAAIKPNGAGQITGQVMQDALVKTGTGIVQELDAAKQDTIQDIDAIRSSAYNAADAQAVEVALAAKQDTLVSGTNIKTVGGNSLLGAGDIPIAAENETDLVYTGKLFHDGDNDLHDVKNLVIGGVTYSDGVEFLESDACKIGRVIAQVNPTEVEPEEGYAYHEVTRFIIKGIDSLDGVITLEKISSAEEISDEIQTEVSEKVTGEGILMIKAISQAAYDALEDGAGYESEILYVIV